jgi:hypothetical protein
MTASTRLQALVLAGGLAVACNPDGVEDYGDDAQRFAAATCKAAQECSCAAFMLLGGDCEDHYIEAFEDAVARDLTLDVECLNKHLDRLTNDPCAMDRAAPDCFVFEGSRDVGTQCYGHADLAGIAADECAGNLVCNPIGLCADFPPTDPLPERQVGEQCWSESVGSCANPDAYCGSDGVCHTRGIVGEPCESLGCVPSLEDIPLFCEHGGQLTTGTCRTQLQPGEPCDPLDFDPCQDVDGEDRSCDAIARVCVVGSEPDLCRDMNYPSAWRQ